ncbi:hypothetical protein CC2G_004822 [Coprinopsis cinerea AmutBmut pab1-1]|nr:hypothetical protein CC2G_004822 [Coprinopsis cinerea AmutBmut pab1-1]
MLYLTSVRKLQVRAPVLPMTGILTFTFITRPGFPPKHSQHPKHERGRNPALRRAEFLSPNRCIRPRAITHPEMPHSLGLSTGQN